MEGERPTGDEMLARIGPTTSDRMRSHRASVLFNADTVNAPVNAWNTSTK